VKLESTHARESTRYFPRCEQCDGLLTVPEWSERVSQRCTRHLWLCRACGYQFEQSVYAAAD
jgi:ribosomal protein L37AE/L43A